MSFANIKGQANAVTFLKGAIKNGRVAHAYIFQGPRGVGKKLAALNFAKALNCLSPAAGDPCDSCVSCAKIDGSNHPDVFVVSCEKEGSSIRIDSVRDVIKAIALKPYEARVKVSIIDDAVFMTQEAANAILKTLEEPPAESVLILIAESTQMLLETIVSRSQVVRFSQLGAGEMKTILANEYSVESRKAHVLAHLFSGRLGEALKHKDTDFFDKRSSLIGALLSGRFFDSDFDKVSKDNVKAYLDVMLTWYRDILARKAGTPAPALINIDRDDDITCEAKRLGYDYLYDVISQIILTSDLIDHSANTKLAMSVLGVKILLRNSN